MKGRIVTGAVIALLSGGSLASCLHRLGARSIWVDEGASLSIASQHGVALFRGIARDGGNQAVYYLLLHVVIVLFGSGTETLRLIAAISSALAVPLTFALGKRLVNRRVGIYAAALVALCEPLVYWGQMARGYTLAATLAAASGWTFVRAAERGWWRDVAIWVVVSVLLCYTGLYSTVLIFVELIAVFAWRDRVLVRNRALAGIGAIAVCCLPLAALARHRGSSQLFWLTSPTHRSVEAALRFVVGSDATAIGHWEASALDIATLGIAAISLLLLGSDWIARRSRAAGSTLFLWLWIAVPFVGAYVVSVAFVPVFLDRYFSTSIPAECVLLAVVLDRVKPTLLGTAVLIGLVLVRFAQIPGSYREVRDNWRAATASLLSRSQPGDCIIFNVNDGWIDFNYYLEHGFGAAVPRQDWPRPVLPSDRFGSDPLIVEAYATLSPSAIAELPKTCDRVWVVESHAATSSPPGSIGQTYHLHFVSMLSDLERVYPARSVARFTYITEYLLSRPTSRR